MTTTLVALGANLGDRAGNLERALRLLDRPPALRVAARSRWFQTSPVGGPRGQPAFLNGAARVETSLTPLQMLAALGEIETQLGRQRDQRWAPRHVDLDLLLFDDLVLRLPRLELPHPRMAFRRFVLEPAAEVAPDLVHPVIGWTIQRLLAHLDTAPNYVAITGAPGTGKTRLAEDVAAATDSRFIGDPDPGAGHESSVEPESNADPQPRGSAADCAAVRPATSERSRYCRRAQLLDRCRPSAGDARVISDFWLGQADAYRCPPSNGPSPAIFTAADAAAACRAVRPKLLVLLDGEPTPPRWEPVRTALRRLVQQPGLGPTLQLDASRPDEALVEVCAAVAAMR